jgi:hypothetical protein
MAVAPQLVGRRLLPPRHVWRLPLTAASAIMPWCCPQVFKPWSSSDQAVALRFTAQFEALVARVVTLRRLVDEVTVSKSVTRKPKSQAAQVLPQGQTALQALLTSCQRHCDSLLLGMQETLRVCDAEGLRSSHRSVEATVTDVSGCLDKCEAVRVQWARLLALCVTLETTKTVVPMEVTLLGDGQGLGGRGARGVSGAGDGGSRTPGGSGGGGPGRLLPFLSSRSGACARC